jgi:hypothetical protein
VSREPDFDELVGAEELTRGERERLRRAHDLLVEAGPPAELPPELATAPSTRASVTVLPRRRRIAAVLVAAALLLLAFGVGYLVADHGRSSAQVAYSVKMRGTKLAPNALATLKVLKADEGGNWPMVMRVTGLKQLPGRGYYELFLTKSGRLGPACGTFRVRGGTTTVRLNAPYHLRDFDGWVITAHRAPGPVSSVPLLST